MKPPDEMETPRLRLRRPVMEDAGSILETYARDQLVTRYLVWRPHSWIVETEELIRRCDSVWADGSASPWVIEQREDQKLMGMIEARFDGHKVDLGYVLGRDFWGMGYMQEAAEAVIGWALNQQEIYRVWAVCDVENTASSRVLEKVGMKEEGVLRRWSIHPNISEEPRDCRCYSITR